MSVDFHRDAELRELGALGSTAKAAASRRAPSVIEEELVRMYDAAG
jgi:hypothetical protein